MYSFGVLCYEIFSRGAVPYAELAVEEVLTMVQAGHRLGQPSPTTPAGVLELIRECTQLHVAKRPSMALVASWFEHAVRQHDNWHTFDSDATQAVWAVRRLIQDDAQGADTSISSKWKKSAWFDPSFDEAQGLDGGAESAL